MILGLNTYEIDNNELNRTMSPSGNVKTKDIELKIHFKDLEKCKSKCGLDIRLDDYCEIC
jgi:hypothetical protein